MTLATLPHAAQVTAILTASPEAVMSAYKTILSHRRKTKTGGRNGGRPKKEKAPTP